MKLLHGYVSRRSILSSLIYSLTYHACPFEIFDFENVENSKKLIYIPILSQDAKIQINIFWTLK
jgi:hypothetical protein